MASSDLQLGPIKFTYHVQDIAIQEQKSVEVLPTARTDKNFIVDNGKPSQKAVIRLLISGISEINDVLRKLVILFKCSPIISVDNEFLQNSWNSLSPVLPIPVALEELTISTAPDLPETYIVSLVITKIDVSSVYPDGVLQYQGKELTSSSPFPEDAYYLKKWLDSEHLGGRVSRDNLGKVEMSWIAKYSTGEPISSDDEEIKKAITQSIVFDAEGSTGFVQNETVAIRNVFAYNNMIGKGSPFPQHMGCTAKFYSIDILFDDNSSLPTPSNNYYAFSQLKDAADIVIRANARFSRLSGFKIKSALLEIIDTTLVTVKDAESSIYVPLNLSVQTAEHPNTKIGSINFAESNQDIFSPSEVLLSQGGSDYDSLKKVFDDVASREKNFRSTFFTYGYFTRKQKLRDILLDPKSNQQPNLEAYQAFWPVQNDRSVEFGGLDTFGLLNRDTLKATFLSLDFDPSEKLKLALLNTVTISGKVRTGTSLPGFLNRFGYNYAEYRRALTGISADEQPYADAFNIMIEYVKKAINYSEVSNLNDRNDAYLRTSKDLFTSFFGEYEGFFDLSNASGELIQNLSKSKAVFTKEFLDSLFSVIIARRASYENFYKIDSIHSAYFKLLVQYLKELETNTDLKNKQTELSLATKRLFSVSNYPDLLLPTYRTLYGEDWELFAPTYATIGIINPRNKTGQGPAQSGDQADPAVTADDIVSPSCWFAVERFKPKLEELIPEVGKNVTDIGNKFHLSLPFNINGIDAIEEELKRVQANPKKGKETLDRLIKQAFFAAQSSPGYDETMEQLALASSEDYREKYFGENSQIYLYVHNVDNYAVAPRLSAPGLAAELYRVANEARLLRPSDRFPFVNVDTAYKPSDRSNEFTFLRGLKENNIATIKSSLDQVTDIFEDPVRMFPAAKVYLLEKRGSDLIGDDSFFSVNPIISINISMDKDDADLAIITVADPLYNLQNSFFPKGNVASVGKDKKSVLTTSQSEDVEGYLSKFKVRQGRRVQIRLGYGPTPSSLDIVFTGKIAEINPGDVLTIVCQGWKTELINREVSFYNDKTKNWGARDLAIMAMEHANPEGFGDFYPQMALNYIKKNLTSADVQDIIATVLRRQENVENVAGTRGMLQSVSVAFGNLLGISPGAKDNEGLDTRLKNIWVADVPEYNNFLNWRGWVGAMPSQANDSWVVPLQPAWEVLKEASRHAWNTIVSVVPFDGEATLFFGTPDSPYYYTKGSNIDSKKWNKYKTSISNIKTTLDELKQGFEGSEFFGKRNDDPYLINVKDDVKKYYNGQEGNLSNKSFSQIFVEGKNDPKYFPTNNFVESITGRGFLFIAEPIVLETLNSNRLNAISKLINRESIFESKFRQIEEKLSYQTIPALAYLFFNIPPTDLVTQVWPTAITDIPLLLSSTVNDNYVAAIQSRINLSYPNLDSKLKDIARYLADFRLYVYFFSEYLSSTDPALGDIAQVTASLLNYNQFPPNLRTFRIHHLVMSEKDIIKNDIVASTREMWNTVVIERPGIGEAADLASESNLLGGDRNFYSGIQWVYWPKNEITGVLGLQFNPALTLRNKKVQVFTELNCQSEELSAKLACTHLADGIRRMYRGSLVITGRLIKPHDRIILKDAYTNMEGPVEVDSVVHHWGADTGWITDIGPQAVCDANPGAAILATAALEDMYSQVFRVIDYAADALTIAFVLGTLGSGTPLAQGANFSIRAGLRAALNGIRHPIKGLVSRASALKETGTLAIQGLKNAGGPFAALKELFRANHKLFYDAFAAWSGLQIARQATHGSFRVHVTSSFIANAQKTEQLPVILSPLFFNGIPFIAGLETDDPVWGVHFNDVFWSLRELNEGAEKVLDQIFGEGNDEASRPR